MDLKRAEFLPPWDEEAVRSIALEMNELYSKVEPLSQKYPNDSPERFQQIYYGQCFLRDRTYLSWYILITVNLTISLLMSYS